MKGSFRLSRLDIVYLVAVAGQSFLLTQFPLLNVLGLEYAGATAPLVALLAGWALLPDRSVAGGLPRIVQAVAHGLLLSVPPLLVGLSAALFIRNCSLLSGLVQYLLIVPPAAVFGVGLAEAARGLSKGWSRSLFVVLWVAVLAHIIFITFTGPQIYAFNPIVGFFPGFSYDDALGLPGSLVLFRIVTLISAFALITLGKFLDGSREQGRAAWRSPSGVSCAVAALIVVVAWWNSDRWGWGSSLEHVKEELQGVRESDHFILIYPSDAVTEEQADRLEALHEFTYERLGRTLHVWPERKITSIIYRDAEQKNRLAGGGRTNFTKPWLWQMHLLHGDVRESLRHEMVHVLAADFGFPLVRIGINAGVIEGLAVALDRTTNGETVHRAAAQILATGVPVSVEGLFSSVGFFRVNSSVSYTLAGSFSRYLIERFGIRSYKVFYRTGDSRQAFIHDLSDLVTGWRRRIDAIPLERSDSLKAAYYYRRPPMYARECFRVIGDMNAAARRSFAEGQDSVGSLRADRSWALSHSPETAFLRAQGLMRTGRYSEAVAFIDTLRADSELWPSVRILELIAGDAWWRLDSLVAAGAAYQRLFEADISTGWTEAAAVRWEGLVRWGWDRDAVEALIGTRPDSVRRRQLEALVSANRAPRKVPYLHYALSRLVPVEKEPAEVIRLLSASPPIGRDVLDHVARRRLASAFLAAGEWEHAKGALWESLNYTDNEADVIDVSESIAFCDWLKQKKSR